jgi:hypothetical protein
VVNFVKQRMKFRVFWDIASCSHVEVDRRFRGTSEIWSTSTWLHGTTSQTTLNFILTAVRTWNLRLWKKFILATAYIPWECLPKISLWLNILMLHVHRWLRGKQRAQNKCKASFQHSLWSKTSAGIKTSDPSNMQAFMYRSQTMTR